MAIGAASRVRGESPYICHYRDGAADRRQRPARDRLDLGTQAAAKVDLVVDGVDIGEEMPVKVKKHGITVRGTAVVSKMNDECSEFEIHIRDKVFGRKVEKDVSVSVEKQADGTYTFKKDEDGKVEQGNVVKVRVEGPTTKLTVPDARKGRMTEIQFTDLGNGRFKIRGDDFTADFNA